MALITTLAVVSYLQRLRQQAVVEAPVVTEAVVFATAHIAERKVVTADAIELREIVGSAVHPAAARRIADVVNRVAVAPIYPGEQVLASKLAPAGISVGLSYILPRDKRALTLAVNEVIGVAGFVYPGDRVDVVGTVTENDESFTKIILQNVEVVALAQKVEQKPGEDPKVTTSATLALTPDQVETLAQIDNIGKIRLALRPYGVTEQIPTTGKTVLAALGRAPQRAAVLSAGPAGTGQPSPAPKARRRAPSPPTATVLPPRERLTSVELWRATDKTTVTLKEGAP
jgi:pilus assembly protein CpaB